MLGAHAVAWWCTPVLSSAHACLAAHTRAGCAHTHAWQCSYSLSVHTRAWRHTHTLNGAHTSSATCLLVCMHVQHAHMCFARAHACVHVCAPVSACVHTRLRVCVYVHACAHAFLRVHVYIHVCVHVSVRMCVWAGMRVHVGVHVFLHVCRRVHANVCVCTCVCTRLQQPLLPAHPLPLPASSSIRPLGVGGRQVG